MMFLAYSLVGALAASILACIHALHTYNVVGLPLLLGAGGGPLVARKSSEP